VNDGRNNDASAEVWSWLLIGIAFIAFWPLGLFLLFKKLAESSSAQKQRQVPPLYAPSAAAAADRASNKKRAPKADGRETFAQRMTRTPKMSDATAKWLKVAGIILMIIGGLYAYNELNMVYWIGFTQYEVWQLVGHAAWIGAGAALFANGQRMALRSRRFKEYYAIIGAAEAMSIEQISRASGYPAGKTEKDVQSMINAGMFGDGAYIDRELGYFFRSSAAATKVSQEQAEQRDDAPKEADEGYSGILRNIRRANDRIADPVLSAKIDRLEEIAGKIFQIVEKDKTKEKRIGTFLNYYLPTTQKLLDAYAEFEATGVNGDNLNEAKKKIEQTMDAIVEGFERQLDMLYQSEAMDVSSDIDVMNAMLKRDGAKSDFSVGGAPAPKPSPKPEPAADAAPAPKPTPKPEQAQPSAPEAAEEKPHLVMRSDGTVGPEE
jgi:hypothetical protein